MHVRGVRLKITPHTNLRPTRTRAPPHGGLKAYIHVKNDSINEALGHAPRSIEATVAQFHLTEILQDSVFEEKIPTKIGDKNHCWTAKEYW